MDIEVDKWYECEIYTGNLSGKYIIYVNEARSVMNQRINEYYIQLIVTVYNTNKQLLQKNQKIHIDRIENPVLIDGNKGCNKGGNKGGNKEYVKLQQGGNRLVRYGSRGGRYYIKGGKRIYI